MSSPTKSRPRPYPEWRTTAVGREEDASYCLGYHLIQHCRDEALAAFPKRLSPEARKAAEEAVDLALHNVMDMAEGYWKLEAGPGYVLEFVIAARVCKEGGEVVETIEISPGKLDLPIGYWKWARDREFR